MNKGFTMLLALILAIPVWAPRVRAGLVTRVVEYREGDTVLKGYLAFDDALRGVRPGILVIPEWWGLNDYARKRAEQLAGLGYAAFAADMYGNGLTTKDPKEAGALAGALKADRARMRARAAAALDVLRRSEMVDPTQVAAIGYCFGGTTVLELAREGADLSGVVSFHGGLETPNPAGPGAIKARLLVLHGADDPFVKPADVAAFEQEMRTSGADWQMVLYGGAVHSFSNPASGSDPSKGVAYNEKADRRSWEAMKSFFQEIF